MIVRFCKPWSPLKRRFMRRGLKRGIGGEGHGERMKGGEGGICRASKSDKVGFFFFFFFLI